MEQTKITWDDLHDWQKQNVNAIMSWSRSNAFSSQDLIDQMYNTPEA